MKIRTAEIKLGLVALALGPWLAALGQSPVISSFSQNGELVCTNLSPGSVATVEWASSVTGPWTNNWGGLSSIIVDSNGMIRVGVPMFYRVLGVAQGTNPVPADKVLIPAGSFTMGDSLDGDSFALPLHTNYVSAFYMDKYEVTKELWDGVYQWATNHGYNFDHVGLGKTNTHPVQTVSWYDAVKWCNARSEREGRTPAYYTSLQQTTAYRTGSNDLQTSFVNWSSGYRLPTEAEWEKAARGGAAGQRFPLGDTISWSQANYYAYPSVYAYDANPTQGYHPTFNDAIEPYTSQVGYFAPNGYGLYDMAGNVWEWCWDWYGSYSSGSQTDPRGPTSSLFRMVRGGGWALNAKVCRTADRGYDYPADSDNRLGFRCLLPLAE